jgi:predicted nucleic acid-binding Zn ribbon protein
MSEKWPTKLKIWSQGIDKPQEVCYNGSNIANKRVSRQMNQTLISNPIISLIILVLVELLIIKELMVVGREVSRVYIT